MHLTQVLQPQLCIPLSQVARFLGIPESLICRMEHWLHVLFVHRADRGGQFLSYRKFNQWLSACALTIQACNDLHLLDWIGGVIKTEIQRYSYPDDVLSYWRHLWRQRHTQLRNCQSTTLQALPRQA
ncbi:hypothetical protein [Leptolyngbya sp. FACHB-261]|uniref:hypothetical protein n=1 Tax=Leptolyngbya sp. FACHB-261 TaxID=2692806 RepID=UPI001685FBC1|nr:hypothetical protein [Leptolyngbya sp. FACHB-261]MBD2104310.1 hypothetical protein [Leptolyngbya sp. FACHB-261]